MVKVNVALKTEYQLNMLKNETKTMLILLKMILLVKRQNLI